MILTVMVVADLWGSSASSAQPEAGSTAGDTAGARSGPGRPGVQADAAPTVPDGVLPGRVSALVSDGGPYTVSGAGTFRDILGTAAPVGAGALVRYEVQVEDGVVLSDGEQAFARAVTATLLNPRSWSADGRVRLQRVDRGPAELQVLMASRDTARELCGFDIPYDTSCFRDGRPGRVVLSTARWERGATAFQGGIGQYRRYLVNHEVGHFFNNAHQPCRAPGAPAPLMMQQTLTTSNDELADLTAGVRDVPIPRDGAICRPSEWPFPNGPRP